MQLVDISLFQNSQKKGLSISTPKLFLGNLVDAVSRRVDIKKEKHKEELEEEAHRRRECTKAVGDDTISPDSVLYKSCNRCLFDAGPDIHEHL